MSTIEKLYYNMEKLTDDFVDSPETRVALKKLEDIVGDLTDEIEDCICDYAVVNEKQGFICGFKYAMSLMSDGSVHVAEMH